MPLCKDWSTFVSCFWFFLVILSNLFVYIFLLHSLVSLAWTSVQHIVPSLGEEPCSGVLHNMHEVPAGPHWGGRTSVPTSSSQCYCCCCSCYCSAYYTFVLTSNQCDIECYYCFYCFCHCYLFAWYAPGPHSCPKCNE